MTRTEWNSGEWRVASFSVASSRAMVRNEAVASGGRVAGPKNQQKPRPRQVVLVTVCEYMIKLTEKSFNYFPEEVQKNFCCKYMGYRVR